MKRILFILLFIPLLLPVAATDTLTIGRKVEQTFMPSDGMRVQLWKNPAIHYYYRDFGLSSLSLQGQKEERNQAALTQKGNGSLYANLHAESFLLLSDKDRVFGEAGYRNGIEKNIYWNENDDFELLYPYFTGDSIGGDLKKEAYYFMGGYARELGAWTLGGRMRYRASLSYRQKDPRPRNIVSDLHFSLGAARRMTDNYRLGVAMHVRKYGQNSEITFYADKGATSVYHLLGLGVDYIRFAGTYFDTRYAGWGMGGSVELLPETAAGFSVSLLVDHFQFKKQLSSLSYLPLVEMKKKKAALEATWIKKIVSREYAVKFNGGWEKQEGAENIFGEPNGKVYPLLNSSVTYTNQLYHITLSAAMAEPVRANRIGWSLMPYTDYRNTESTYKSADRMMKIATFTGGIDGRILLKKGCTLWTVAAQTAYSANETGDSRLTNLDKEKSLAQALLHDFAYLTDDHWHLNLSLRADYFLRNNKALSLSSGWLHEEYAHSGKTNSWRVSIGFIY